MVGLDDERKRALTCENGNVSDVKRANESNVMRRLTGHENSKGRRTNPRSVEFKSNELSPSTGVMKSPYVHGPAKSMLVW